MIQNMYCFRAKRLMHRFLDRELSAARSAQVEAHIEHCGSCRQALAELLRLEEQLDAARLPEIPAGFATQVVERALGASTPVKGVGARWVSAVAAACALILVAWGGFRIGEAYSAPQPGVIQVALSSPIDLGF